MSRGLFCVTLQNNDLLFLSLVVKSLVNVGYQLINVDLFILKLLPCNLEIDLEWFPFCFEITSQFYLDVMVWILEYVLSSKRYLWWSELDSRLMKSVFPLPRELVCV